MKLYLLSDDGMLLQRWKTLLVDLDPAIIFSFDMIATDAQSVVIVSDTTLSGMTESLDPTLRVLVLSSAPNFEQSQDFLRKGAMGYGNAFMHETHLYSAFKSLEDGDIWLYPDFVSRLILQVQNQAYKKEKMLHSLDCLTAREREVATLLGDGKSHHEIAESLGITIRTVKAHSSAIYEKLGVKDRLALSLLLHT